MRQVAGIRRLGKGIRFLWAGQGLDQIHGSLGPQPEALVWPVQDRDG